MFTATAAGAGMRPAAKGEDGRCLTKLLVPAEPGGSDRQDSCVGQPDHHVPVVSYAFKLAVQDPASWAGHGGTQPAICPTA